MLTTTLTLLLIANERQWRKVEATSDLFGGVMK
jgi:hypothetical protein